MLTSKTAWHTAGHSIDDGSGGANEIRTSSGVAARQAASFVQTRAYHVECDWGAEETGSGAGVAARPDAHLVQPRGAAAAGDCAPGGARAHMPHALPAGTVPGQLPEVLRALHSLRILLRSAIYGRAMLYLVSSCMCNFV